MSSQIRSKEQLEDFLAQNLAWRKKELSALKLMMQSKEVERNKTHRSCLLRSGILLLYAHWEGFIKDGATAYVCFVAMQRLRNSQLSPNFLALSLKNIFTKTQSSNRPNPHISAATFIINEMDAQSKIMWKTAISTESNLSSNILRDITMWLGIDYSPYETKEKLIDEKLVYARNCVAHGDSDYTIGGVQDYIYLHGQVIGLLNTFHTQISNAASLGKYQIDETRDA